MKPAHWDWSGIRVTVIGSRDNLEQELRVCHGPCHGTDHSHRGKGSRGDWKVARRGDTARRGFQTADSGEMRRHADRSASVAANPAGRHPGCDRGGFAAARSSGRSLQIPRVVGVAVELVVGFPGHEEFRCVRVAQDNGPGFLEPPYQGRIGFGVYPLTDYRAAFPRETTDGDRTLDADRHSFEPSGLPSARHPCARRARRLAGAVGIDMRERIQPGIELLDSFQVGFNQIEGRPLAVADALGHAGR